MAANVDGSSSINVAVRVRPFTIREAAQLTRADDAPLFLGDGSLAAVPSVPKLGAKGIRSVIKVVDEKCLVFDPPEDSPVQRFSRSMMPQGRRAKDQTFAFDRVFDENTTQGDVYEATTKNLLDSVLDGYNATVFAYGATGCGKTHTITGTAQQPGIIFMTMQELFEKVGELQDEKESEVSLSYLEIYNETIRDLLNPAVGTKAGLMLREDAHQAVSVAGLSSHHPQNVQEVMDMVIRGNAARTQSPTEANATSSRSHAVLQINVSLKDRNASTTEPVTMATLSIIDLAGSERASATKNRGERLLEGANINKSLLALGSCINALCDPRKRNHVPYRNSKLTRLLKFSLGGNCRTVMIVCVSPSSAHFDETQNTLRYANRAKNIQTKSVRNVYNVDRHVKDYLKKIDEQMNRINELTKQQKEAEEIAFAKYRKTESRRKEILHDGLQRLRAAYDHSKSHRDERLQTSKRLRLVERRIGAISSWIGAFDHICHTREDEEPPASMLAMRKTAQGILVELESSRQHFHQWLAKSNWTRAIDTALHDGLRQLQNLESAGPDSLEELSLHKEADLLKQRADTDMYLALLEQEKISETELMYVMLTAHFETIAILNQILAMTEEEAVASARSVLGKILQSCTESVGQVIKPDGSLQVVDAVPAGAKGTPKKRKAVPLMGPSPLKSRVKQSSGLSSVPPHLRSEIGSAGLSPAAGSSPLRSPKRRVRLGGARKIAMGTPKKRSPSKKRAVRWRDDEEQGKLVEFQKTPEPAAYSSPIKPDLTTDPLPTQLDLNMSALGLDEELDSSPVPAAPVPKSEGMNEVRKAGTGRFALGALQKAKAAIDSPTMDQPSIALAMLSLGDGNRPLREIRANAAPQPRASSEQSQTPADDSTPSLSSEGSENENSFAADKETAAQIRGAMKLKRNSSIGGNTAQRKRDRESMQRRRSPSTSSSCGVNGGFHRPASSSPPPENGMFTASHARRMVTGSKAGDDLMRTVLSPRTAPVTKGSQGARRSMIETSAAGTPKEGIGHRGAVRMSAVLPGSAQGQRTKSVWR